MADLITAKIEREIHEDVKLIALKKKEKFYQTIRRLVQAEKKKLRLS